MKLIDVDAIEIDEECTFSGKNIKDFLDIVSASYDVDEVVERLKDAKDSECNSSVPKIRMCDAIEIVKSGGID